MDKYSYVSNANPAYIEELYATYKQNPDSVEPKWRTFFEGFDFSDHVNQSNPLQSNNGVSNKEIAVSKLIYAYRNRGHLIAKTNPVRERRTHKADLSLSYFNLSESDLTSTFQAGAEIGLPNATLDQILKRLTDTYCSSIGVEFMYCQNEKLREWMVQKMEPITNTPSYPKQKQLQI